MKKQVTIYFSCPPKLAQQIEDTVSETNISRSAVLTAILTLAFKYLDFVEIFKRK